MPYRPLLAIAILVCSGSAFLLELRIAEVHLQAVGAVAMVVLAVAAVLNRTVLIRPSAAVVMSCWVALHAPGQISGHLDTSRTGRFEGTIASVRTGRSASTTLTIDGEADLLGTPAVNCRTIVRIPELDTSHRQRLQVGARVIVFARCQPTSPPEHPRLFDPQRWMRGTGAALLGTARQSDVHVIASPPPLQQLISDIRTSVDSVLHAYAQPHHAAILSALVIGQRDGIDDETRSNFNRSGVAHILSVSGSHVGLVITILLSVIGPLARSRTTVILSLLVLLWYAVLTGAEAPTLRACFMAAAAVIGSFRQRHVDHLNLLGAATLVALLVAPAMIMSPSFLLSTIATYGILVIQPQWQQALKVPRSLRSTLALNLSACGVMGLPTVLLLDSIAMLAPIANLVVVPLMTIAMIGGIALVTIGTVLPFTTAPIVWCSTLCLEGALWFARTTADLSPVFSPIATVLAAIGNSVLLIWPSVSRDRKGLVSRMTIAVCWFGLLMSFPRPQSTIALSVKDRQLVVIVDHRDRLRICTIYRRYGAVFVRSHHADPFGIPQR
jgi:ComEC/Rec2-related protein